MIISHKYQFIFIKTAKTAGTSIEVFVSQACGPHDVITPIYPQVEPHRPRNHEGYWNPIPEVVKNRGEGWKKTWGDLKARRRFYNHMPAELLRDRIPRSMWRSYYKFCVERNPWDKTLSHYHMLNDRQGGTLSFDSYLQKGNFCWNHPKYLDSRQNIMVDRIIRYETLREELAEVFGLLGIPFNGDLGVRAKSSHRKDRRPYQQVYSERQRRVIETAFSREIALHGYRF